MAVLPTQTPNSNGAVVTRTAVSSADKFDNTGRTLLLVVNGSGGSLTVTLDIQNTVDGQAITDKAVTLTDGQEKVIGPFPPGIYNDANGQVNVAFSATTSVTAALLQIP